MGFLLDPLNAVEVGLRLSRVDALNRSNIVKLEALAQIVRPDCLEQWFAVAEVQESSRLRHLCRLCALAEAKADIGL